MKVIFLDIDGVLNVYPQGIDKFGHIFHKHFENNLSEIIKVTDAKIVITSTWKSNGINTIIEMWETRGLPGEIIGITPYCEGVRGDEIERWIEVYTKYHRTGKKHDEWSMFFNMNNSFGEIESYVIIDDDDDMLDHQMKNFVKTSDNSHHIDCVDIGYGLTSECSELAISILNNNIY